MYSYSVFDEIHHSREDKKKIISGPKNSGLMNIEGSTGSPGVLSLRAQIITTYNALSYDFGEILSSLQGF